MFGNKPPRTGQFITLLGLVVLGASYYSWVHTSPHHRLYYAQDEYKWVRADSSDALAVESDEVWQTSANCEMPFFLGATLRARGRLKAVYAAIPEEIRAWRDRLAHRANLRARTVSRGQAESEQSVAEKDYESELHVKYMEWYTTVSEFEQQAKQWERRLNDLADQNITVSEARHKSETYSSNNIEQGSANYGFEHYIFSLLGLGGFSDDKLQAIKAMCVQVVPVKRIFIETNYHSELWRWPVDHVVAFGIGIELVICGLLFGSITRWINTGEAPPQWQHICDAAKRFVVFTCSVVTSKVVFIVQKAQPHVAQASLVSTVRGLFRKLAIKVQTLWPHISKTVPVVITVGSLLRRSFVFVLQTVWGATIVTGDLIKSKFVFIVKLVWPNICQAAKLIIAGGAAREP